MDNIYHYVVTLPPGIDEAVLICADGYTIYTADRLSRDEMRRAYEHALKHIERDDFHADLSVGRIEREAHES